MKQLSDEEIQRLLDEELEPGPSDGVDIYQKIFSELSKPTVLPSADSANAIVQVIHRQSERRSDFKAYAVIGLCLITGMLLFFAVTYCVDSLLAERIIQTVVRLRWVLLFSIFIVIFSIVSERLFSSNKREAFRWK